MRAELSENSAGRSADEVIAGASARKDRPMTPRTPSAPPAARRRPPAQPPVAVGEPLRLEDLEAVARAGREVVFGPAARARVASSRAAIEAIALQGDEAPRVYGVNTGFGALSEARISSADIRQ